MENNGQEKKHEFVDHADHYNNYDVETIEMISRIWGDYIASMWSEINAFKYRMRMGTKPTAPIEQDLEKEKVYKKYYQHYRDKWKSKDVIYFDELPEHIKEFVEKIEKRPTMTKYGTKEVMYG